MRPARYDHTRVNDGDDDAALALLRDMNSKLRDTAGLLASFAT
jgi:hypothetical protein